MTHHHLFAFIPVVIGSLTAVAMSLFAAYQAWKQRPADEPTKRRRRA